MKEEEFPTLRQITNCSGAIKTPVLCCHLSEKMESAWGGDIREWWKHPGDINVQRQQPRANMQPKVNKTSNAYGKQTFS